MTSTRALASTAATAAKHSVRVLRTHALMLGGMLSIMVVTFAANWIVGGLLNAYGVIPGTTRGLRGIVFAPFIHGSWSHFAANAIPFLTLGWLVLLRETKHFFPVTLFAMLGAGAGAWLFGAPNSVHIGASGIVFGYLGFLMLTGWFDRSVISILLSLVVTVVWGGLVAGIMPGATGISWQAHFGGFVGGALAAALFRTRRRSKSHG